MPSRQALRARTGSTFFATILMVEQPLSISRDILDSEPEYLFFKSFVLYTYSKWHPSTQSHHLRSLICSMQLILTRQVLRYLLP